MRRKVTGRIPSLLAVRCHGRIQAAGSDACPGHRALAPGRIGRLSRPHRGAPPVSIYAALIGRRPNRYGRAHTQAAERIPRPHRELSRYLCKLRDWAQAQSYAAGLPAVCHKWSGALPPQAYATTRHSPRLGTLPGLRWQRERLQCQHHLTSVYAICPAGLAPWLLLVSSRSL